VSAHPKTAEPLFAAAWSTKASWDTAWREASSALREGLGGRSPDLVVAFVSHAVAGPREEIGQRLSAELHAKTVLACGARGVLGGEREVEAGPALSLWAACLPDTEVRPFEVRLGGEEGTAGTAFEGLPEVRDASRAGVLVLADPYSFPVVDWIEALHDKLPETPVLGGLAVPEDGSEHALLCTANGVSNAGAIGVVVEGAVALSAAVSQGCKPVGKPWVVTGCEDNLVLKLSGRPAMEVLMETLAQLPPEEREALQRGPFLGLAVDARKSVFGRGDFLARGLIGIDKKRSALAVADPSLRNGMSVQFLVRDAASAGEDILHSVACVRGARRFDRTSAGALVFTCNGRGQRMFGEEHHDARHLRQALGADVPVAGFFALGEIGPIGGRNFVHGFTASTAIFHTRS
jgi:small ligand-binding sensory domain FIST